MLLRYKKNKTVSANASSSLNLNNSKLYYRIKKTVTVTCPKGKRAVIYSVISYIRKSTVYSLLRGKSNKGHAVNSYKQ